MIKKNQNLILKLMFFCYITMIFSTTLTLSKYSSTVVNQSNTKIAKFIVDLTPLEGQPSNLSIICSNNEQYSKSYKFSVKNNKENKISDVSIKYSIIVTLSEALPQGVKITLNGKESEISSDGLKYTFLDMGEFYVDNSQEHTFELTFTVKAKELQKDISLEKIKINLLAEQIN